MAEPVRMTAAEFRALGVSGEVTKAKVRTTGRVAKGAAFHTRCTACGEVFHTAASEDRHVALGHNRFELIAGYTS
jgi:uncharacterized C2H2 Zn-finger protein